MNLKANILINWKRCDFKTILLVSEDLVGW